MILKPRAEASRATQRKVLIVCEGAKTEPNYFKAFRVSSQVCDIEGSGHNTLSLVRQAVQLSKLKNYREVWCVFDRDSFPAKNIRAAYALAAENNFKVAYSNECFEIWYILHFKYLESELNRQQYIKQLKKELGKYEKNSIDMYDRLLKHQEDAIRNATKLKQLHGVNADPSKCTPYTTVHELVKRLNGLALKAT